MQGAELLIKGAVWGSVPCTRTLQSANQNNVDDSVNVENVQHSCLSELLIIVVLNKGTPSSAQQAEAAGCSTLGEHRLTA